MLTKCTLLVIGEQAGEFHDGVELAIADLSTVPRVGDHTELLDHQNPGLGKTALYRVVGVVFPTDFKMEKTVDVYLRRAGLLEDLLAQWRQS